MVDTAQTKVFTGFVRGRTFAWGDVRLVIGETQKDWATISLLCLDQQGFEQPGRILIAATGQMQNSGARLENLGQDRITLQAGWGHEPLLCEGVPARISLPLSADRVQLFALDAAGKRRESIRVKEQHGQAVLQLSPTYKTLWYEVVVK